MALELWLVYFIATLGLALTPGPNMIYLVSRSISQGPRAGLISLCGIAAGFVIYMLCAAPGLVARMFDAGRSAAQGFVDANLDHIGARDTVDLPPLYG